MRLHFKDDLYNPRAPPLTAPQTTPSLCSISTLFLRAFDLLIQKIESSAEDHTDKANSSWIAGLGWVRELKSISPWFHVEFTDPSDFNLISLRFHVGFTSAILRFHFDVAKNSLRFHFDLTSTQLPIHFDFTLVRVWLGFTPVSLSFYFHVTLNSLRHLFDLTPISLGFHFEITSTSLRFHFSFISVSFHCHVGSCSWNWVVSFVQFIGQKFVNHRFHHLRETFPETLGLWVETWQTYWLITGYISCMMKTCFSVLLLDLLQRISKDLPNLILPFYKQ